MAQQISKKFIKPNAIDGSKIQLSNNEALRAKNPSGTDVDLIKLDDSNIVRIPSAPLVAVERTESNALQTKSQLDTAVGVVSDALDAEITRAQAAELAEQTARQGADTTLQGNIDAEATARQAADTTLQSNIDGKADRNLGNLTGPTAINQALLPDAPISRSIGGLGTAWGSVFATRYGAPTASFDVGLVNGASGQNQVTLSSTAGLSGIGIHFLVVPSLGINISINAIVNGTTIGLAQNLPQTLTNVQAYVVCSVSVRSENETGAKASGHTFIRSGSTASGKSGNMVVQSGASSAGGATGDVQVLAGSTSGSRGKVILDGAYIDVSFKQLKNVFTGSDATDAINKAQLDAEVTRATGAEANLGTSIANETSRALAAEGVLQGNIDSEEARAEAAEAALQAAINAVVSNMQWRDGAFLISTDPELQAAVEGDALTSILPFLDDEAPQLTIADFAADQLLVAKNGATSKIMKVYDDAGTLKVTFVGVEALAEGHTFMVKNDLTDSPSAQENQSIWTFTGAEMVKVGDIDWSLASGIDLSPSYAPLTGTVSVGDSVEVAIAKNAGNLAAEISRAQAAEGVLQDNIDAEQAAREAADVTLQSNIDAEVTRAEAAEAALQGDIDAEVARAQGAEDALDTRVTALENATANWNKMKIVVNSTVVSNGYVDLAHPALDKSIVAFVGRLGLHKDEDFSVSVVGGVTRLTFINSVAAGGDEAIADTDNLFITYQY